MHTKRSQCGRNYTEAHFSHHHTHAVLLVIELFLLAYTKEPEIQIYTTLRVEENYQQNVSAVGDMHG